MSMKKLKFIIALPVFLLVSSCNFLLDEPPVDTLQEDELTAEHIQSLVRGVYHTLADCTPAGLILNDCLGETIENNANNGSLVNANIAHNNFMADNSFVENYYYYLYSVIHQANYVINFLNTKADLTDERNVQMIGSLHYLRAYCYLKLVTQFGDVPIVTQVTEDVVPRSPAADVWQRIKDDLAIAADQCRAWDQAPPEDPTAARYYYYASTEAASALLARVYLYNREYNKAKAIARTFLEDQRFQMVSANSLGAAAVGVGAKELIMCISNNTGAYFYRNIFNTYAMTPSGSYQFKPTQSFIDSVDPDDARYTVCIGLSPDGYTTVNKFNYNAVSTCPFTISRFTEMYLIFAECAPDESGLAKLNELRAARNLPPLDKKILDNPSQYVDAILDERKIEFYGENQYFYDLVRLGKALERLVYTKSEYQFLLPIPQSQVNLGLKQNPGYL